MSKKNYFAEVIESSLDNFLAQCWQWDFFPKFGSLVQVENESEIILGIVYQVNTGSMDPMRYPFPYQKTEKELREEQPQIFEFLKTTFKVQVCGFVEKKAEDKIFYILPTNPCKIHSFVQEATLKMVANFFKDPNFLHILFAFSGQISNLDELLLAIFRHLFSQKLISLEKMDIFCHTFSLLTGNDYRRLKLFLKRVDAVF